MFGLVLGKTWVLVGFILAGFGFSPISSIFHPSFRSDSAVIGLQLADSSSVCVCVHYSSVTQLAPAPRLFSAVSEVHQIVEWNVGSFDRCCVNKVLNCYRVRSFVEQFPKIKTVFTWFCSCVVDVVSSLVLDTGQEQAPPTSCAIVV